MTEQVDDSDVPARPEPPEEPGPPDYYCNARTRDGTPCRRREGEGTATGPGGPQPQRCKFHGGLVEGDGRLKHGLDSALVATEDGARVAEILDRDEAPTDGMRAAAAMMRLVAEKFLAQHVVGRQQVDPDTLEQAQKVLDRVSLASTRLSKAEDRRSVEPERVSLIINQITRIVEEKAGPEVASAVGRELVEVESEVVEE